MRAQTTLPLATCSNLTFTVDTDFAPHPQAPRNSGTPGLGYHYAPLDYALGGCHTAADLSLLVTAGIALGRIRTNSGWQRAGQGLHLRGDGAPTRSPSFNPP